jgi:hypothetical protein
MKRIALIGLAVLWAAQASAESQFGVAVYPGAKADATVTRDLKEKMSLNAFAYRTNDSVVKVTEFYRKQKLEEAPGTTKESAGFMQGPVMVTIQNPWLNMSTGKLTNDTLISIVNR